MANKKAAIKAMKQAAKRRLRNKSVESRIKTFRKKVWMAIDEKNEEKAKERLIIAIREMDKAVSKGIWHRNEAARKKSRLMKRFNMAFRKQEESTSEGSTESL